MARGSLSILLFLGAIASGASPREQLVALRAKLAAKKTLRRSSGNAAELAFAAKLKDPQLAAEIMYDVGFSETGSERTEVSPALEKLLKTHPDVQPWAGMASYWLGVAHARRSSTRARAIELFETCRKLEGLPAALRADALYRLGLAHEDAEQREQALPCFQAFLRDHPDQALRCAGALARTGALHIYLKQPQEAFEAYQKLSKEYPWALVERRDLLLAVTQAYRTAKDPKGAIEAYTQLLTDLPGRDSRRAQAYAGLAAVHAQQGDAEAAIAVYIRMAQDPGVTGSYRSSAYRSLLALYQKAKNDKAIIRTVLGLIAESPQRLTDTQSPLNYLVEALIRQNRIDEAIAFARAHYQLTYMSTTYLTESVLSVVRALKAKQGSLRQANAFISYVEAGGRSAGKAAGAQANLPDPLAGFVMPPEPERDRLFAEAAARLRTRPLELGALYVCWGKTNDALRAYRRNYLETIDATRLQIAVTHLARAMRALGFTEAELDTFFAYQNYGPAGPDGKPGTNDDLKDPILERK